MPLDRPRTGSDWIAPDCAGMDFHAADHGLRDLLAIYLPPDLLDRLTPHYRRPGQLGGGRLDELARIADGFAGPLRFGVIRPGSLVVLFVGRTNRPHSNGFCEGLSHASRDSGE